MNVLLVQDVPGLGRAGQTKKVADGYARNYLIPRKLAVPATPNAIKQMEAAKQAAAQREAENLAKAQELAAALNAMRLTFRVKTAANDRLFGAITAADIAEALEREHKLSIDKRWIMLEHPIKDLGERSVPIKLSAQVIANLQVNVEKE